MQRVHDQDEPPMTVMTFSTPALAATIGVAFAGILAPALPAAAQAAATVYRCPAKPDEPNTPVLYTDQLTAKEASDRGCRPIEGAPITVIQSTKPRASALPSPPATRPDGSKVEPGDQKSRDTESRRILEGELHREEERLADLRREYNNGEPERQGNERNYAKYQERVADLKTSIARKESDIASIRREIGKLSP